MSGCPCRVQRMAKTATIAVPAMIAVFLLFLNRELTEEGWWELEA